LSTSGQSSIVVDILGQKGHESFGILTDKLCNLRVTSGDLLKDGLEHLRLSLDELAKLLELRVVSEEFQRVTTCTQSSLSALSGLSCTSASATTTLASLSGGLKEVDILIFTTGGLGGSSSRGCRGSLTLSRRGLVLLLLLLLTLSALGNAVQKVFDSAVGVEESGAHGTVDIGARETHGLHVRDGRSTLIAESECRGVVEAGALIRSRRRSSGHRGRSGGGRGCWCL
jgi:hypothetical protein